MSYSRKDKLSESIKRILSDIIIKEIKDPRVSKLSSVTHVSVGTDLRLAQIYVSVFDPSHSIEDHLNGLEKAKGFIRKRLGEEMTAHRTPDLVFKNDSVLDYANHINELISKINKE